MGQAAADCSALAPAGLSVRAEASLRRLDDGRTLIGGSGLRIVRLSERGAAVVSGWLDGMPVGHGSGERALARRLLNAGMVHPAVDPGDPNEITVVVPVRSGLVQGGSGRTAPVCNATELLEQLLQRLQGVRMVVVDDGSADEAGVRAAAERFGAELIRRPSSGGPAQARNAGLAVVQTQLVAFVDVDTECSSDDLARLAGHLADREVAAAAPRMTSQPGSNLLTRYEEHFSPLDLGDRPGAVGPGRMVAYVPSAVLVARTEELNALGGFDPQLRYGEDVDLVWRLVADGGIVRYDPVVAVRHLPRRTWAAWLRQRHDYGSAAAPLGRRHGRSVAPARCSASAAAVWALIVLRRPRDAAALGTRSLRLLTDSLTGLPNARNEALKLALRGHLAAGRGLAAAIGRAWWPLAIVGAVAIRRLRAPTAAALLVGPVLEYAQGRRPADPLRTVALRVLDQAAYGAGVWRGALAERSITALLPDLVGDPRPAGNRVRCLDHLDP